MDTLLAFVSVAAIVAAVSASIRLLRLCQWDVSKFNRDAQTHRRLGAGILTSCGLCVISTLLRVAR